MVLENGNTIINLVKEMLTPWHLCYLLNARNDDQCFLANDRHLILDYLIARTQNPSPKALLQNVLVVQLYAHE